MSDHLVESIQYYLAKNNIHVDTKEIELQLYSHPDSPSLFAISETLTFLNIKNIATRLDLAQTTELPMNFIAMVESNKYEGLVHVERINENFGLRYNSINEEIISEKAFRKQWSGIVLLIEPWNKSKRIRSFIGERKIVFTVLMILIFLSISDTLLILYSLLAAIGLIITDLIFKKEIGDFSSTISKKLCKNNSKVNCDKVITSSFKIGIFSLNDLLTSLFVTQILFSVKGDLSVMATILIVQILASFMVISSVYIQGAILKMWCTLCLLAGSVILLQTAALFIFGAVVDLKMPYAIMSRENVFFLLCLTAVAVIINYYRKSKMTERDNNELELSYRTLKRNPSVFRALWIESTSIERFLSSDDLIFGNRSGKYHVEAVLSTTCGYCKESFQKFLRAIQDERNKEVKFSLRFRTSIKSNVLNMMIHLFEIESNDIFLESINDWYENRNESAWLEKWTIPLSDQDSQKSEDKLLKFKSWCDNNNLYFTPAIMLNGKILPKEFNLDDLHEIIEIFESDPNLYLSSNSENGERSKEQNAKNNSHHILVR